MNSKSRKGDWFVTYTGRKFWPLDPHPDDFCIEDIAHHLSLTCRFGGAVSRFYSVGQHSLYVAEIGRPEDFYEALLHDASEAYLGDVVRPLKYQLPEYLEAEHRVNQCVSLVFGVPTQTSAHVKQADNVALMTERDALFLPGSRQPFPPELENLPRANRPLIEMIPAAIELEFLKMFQVHRPYN